MKFPSFPKVSLPHLHMKLPAFPRIKMPAFPQVKLPTLPRPSKSRPQQTACGLDIGSHSIKWVEIGKSSGKRELLSFNVVPFKRERGQQALVAAIREAVPAPPPGSIPRRIVGAISGQSVIARYATFPKMTREELYSHVEVEADKYIPFNIKDVILDCQILEEKKEEGKVYALLVAAKKEVVNYHLATLQDAGVEIDSLDVDTFAVVNAFEHFLGSQTSAVYQAVLDMGAKGTNLCILRGATTLFSRNIPIGGTDFTQAISEKSDLEGEAAEVLKCSGNKAPEELLALLGSSLENLMSEVKLSFDYFENQYDKRVDKIYLSGGSSRLPGLLPYVQRSLNMESLSWDPFTGMTIASDRSQKLKTVRESLATAVGLALRSAL